MTQALEGETGAGVRTATVPRAAASQTPYPLQRPRPQNHPRLPFLSTAWWPHGA
jgi:hypothetical protein